MPAGNTLDCKTLGSHTATRVDEMAAFDILPAEVKAVLANARFKFSAISIAQSFKRGMEIEDVLRHFPLAEAKVLADTEMLRTWSARHPQAIFTGQAGKSLKELDL